MEAYTGNSCNELQLCNGPTPETIKANERQRYDTS